MGLAPIVVLAIFGVLALVLALIAGPVEPEPYVWEESVQEAEYIAPPTVEPPKILSYSGYYERDYVKIVGEIENTLQTNINYAKIIVTFYDEQDKVIGSSFAFTDLEILKPNQKSPFVVSSYPDKINPSTYKTQLSYKKTSEEPFEGLEILSHTPYTDNRGYYKIVGEVQNNGARESSFVKVVCTYYDEQDNVIGTSFVFTQLDTIPVGISAPFELSSYPRTLRPSYYKLDVEGR